jgi:CheY-like chemotaxis protein
VCQRILRNHGGEIAVESTPEVGTTVTVWLPLARGDQVAAGQDETPVRTVPGARVLVLEDEDVMQALTAGVLRRQGYEVVVCDDGDEALHLVAEQAFDLVLVDLQMRGTNGAAFLRELAKLAPSKRPVGLALTGRAAAATARDHVALGVFDTVRKPWQARELCEKVYAALASRRDAP